MVENRQKERAINASIVPTKNARRVEDVDICQEGRTGTPNGRGCGLAGLRSRGSHRRTIGAVTSCFVLFPEILDFGLLPIKVLVRGLPEYLPGLIEKTLNAAVGLIICKPTTNCLHAF